MSPVCSDKGDSGSEQPGAKPEHIQNGYTLGGHPEPLPATCAVQSGEADPVLADVDPGVASQGHPVYPEKGGVSPGDRSRSGSQCSAHSLTSALNDASCSGSPQRHAPATTQMPKTLSELQDPQTFSLGDSTPPGKRKITKASFAAPNSNTLTAAASSDPDDPLNMLDPLWTVKDKK